MIGVVEFTPELGFQLFGGGGGAAGWLGGVLGGDAGAEAPLPPLAGGALGSGIVTTPEPSEPPLEDPDPACVPVPPPEEADDPPRAGAADPTPRDELPEAAEPPDVPLDPPDPPRAPGEVKPPVDGEPPVRTDPAPSPSDRCDADEAKPVDDEPPTTRPTMVAGSRPSPPLWLPSGTTMAGCGIGERTVLALAPSVSDCSRDGSMEAGSRTPPSLRSRPVSYGVSIAAATDPSLENAAWPVA